MMLSLLVAISTVATCDIALTGGNVWTPEGFVARDVFIDGRHFTIPVDPATCTEQVNVSGQYLSPAFGEGHSHNVEAPWSFDSLNTRYLSEGVYYVLNPLNMPAPANALRSLIDQPDTIDVAFTHGGLTSYHGHPEAVYVISLSPILYGNVGREAFVGQAFHTISSEDDILFALDRLVEQGADAVKIVLAHSEEFAERNARISDEENWQRLFDLVRDESSPPEDVLAMLLANNVGLDPQHVPLIVEAAHARGLRVLAHVNTAIDFEIAALAGVDAVIHMPGAYIVDGITVESLTLTDASIEAAVRNGMTVVATANVRPDFTAEEDREALIELQRSNIRRLLDAGVPVYIGTDRWQVMASDEVAYFIESSIMTPRESFEAWIDTGRFVFPERQIGRIEPGYEADLLVFAQDPGTGMDALGSITIRIKSGAMLDIE